MGKRERKQRAMVRMVARFEESGLTCEEFARRSRVSVAKLSYWRGRTREARGSGHAMREEATSQVDANLLPLSLVLGPGSIEPHRPSFEIILTDGRRLIVPSDFSTEGLRRLLEVVGC